MSALVSVVIPTFNHGQFIQETLESVFTQTYRNIEIIVVDDGSTDNTFDLLSQYRNRIKIIKQDNKGVASARNRGFLESTGEYIQFIDADDLLVSTKFEIQLDYLNKNKHINLVYSDFLFFNTKNKNNTYSPDFKYETINIFPKLLNYNFIWIQTVLIRRSLFNKLKGFKGKGDYLLGVDDWEFVLRAAYTEKEIGFIPEVLVLIRRSTQGLTSNREAMSREAIHALKEFRKYVSKEDKKKYKLKKIIRHRQYLYGIYLFDSGYYFKSIREVIKSMQILDKDVLEKIIALVMLTCCLSKKKREVVLNKINGFYFKYFKRRDFN